MTLALPRPAAAGSPLARRDARWRLAAFVVFAAGCAAVRAPGGGAVVLVAALVTAALGRVPVFDVLGRAGLLALSAAPVLVLGPLTSPEPGVGPAVALLLRVVAVGVAGLTLVRVAPLADTFTAAQMLGAPGKLVQVARLADRYSRLLFSEARRVRVALRTRGFVVRTDRHTYRTLGNTVAGLLVRADDRADRVAAAMRARGFTGTARPTLEPRTSPGDVVLLLLAVVVIIVAVVCDRWPS